MLWRDVNAVDAGVCHFDDLVESDVWDLVMGREMVSLSGGFCLLLRVCCFSCRGGSGGDFRCCFFVGLVVSQMS